MEKKKRLYRTENNDAKFLGVCGGIAEYFDVDPTLVRVGWIALSCCFGSGFLAYLICALCMPKKSELK